MVSFISFFLSFSRNPRPLPLPYTLNKSGETVHSEDEMEKKDKQKRREKERHVSFSCFFHRPFEKSFSPCQELYGGKSVCRPAKREILTAYIDVSSSLLLSASDSFPSSFPSFRSMGE